MLLRPCTHGHTAHSSASDDCGPRQTDAAAIPTPQAVFTAAVEAGVQHFAFEGSDRALAAAWAKIAAIPHTLWLADAATEGRQTLAEGEGEHAVRQHSFRNVS